MSNTSEGGSGLAGSGVPVLAQPRLSLATSTPELLVRVRQLTADLAEPGPGLSQEDRTAFLAELETLKNVCAGAQAAITVDLDEQAAVDRERGRGELGHRRREREGVTLEVSLARRISPQRSRSLIELAKALHHRLPRTRDALRVGRVSEYASTLVVKHTKDLSDEQALAVDAELASDLGTCSEGRLEKRVMSLAYEADKRGYLQRHAKAVQDRYVSIRPAPEGMVRLSGLLPLAEGVAVYKVLDSAAAAAKSSGREGTRANARADELVRLITGIDPAREGVPIEIGLVMTDRTLLDDGEEPGRVPGYGPVPAALARLLAAFGSTRAGPGTAPRAGPDATRPPRSGAARPDLGLARAGPDEAPERARAWVRRLYLDPVDSTLHDVDARRRLFTGPLRRYILARDQECAMPYCHAPIRAIDHIDRARDDGPTTGSNGQGLCESCNLDKEAEDLRTVVTQLADDRRAVRVRTRYGQVVHAAPPPVLDTFDDLSTRWHGERPPWWCHAGDDLEEWEHGEAWDGEDWADEAPLHETADPA